MGPYKPPFRHLSVLTVRSVQEELAEFSLRTLHKRLQAVLPQGVEITEPAPAPIAKAHGQFRFQCTINALSARTVADIVSHEIARLNTGEDITITLDIDAYSFM